MKKNLIITSGDLAGIGPEVIAKSLNNSSIVDLDINFIILGLKNTILKQLEINTSFKSSEINIIDNFSKYNQNYKITILDFNYDENINIEYGKISQLSGKLSFFYVQKAIELSLENKYSLITAPINKEAWNKSGILVKGHTDYLAQQTNTDSYSMTFYSEDLKVTLVTTHKPLRQVSAFLSKELILEKIILSNNFIKKLGIQTPKIAVCGFNPHAGEQGLLGDEEKNHIIPAIKEARKRGIDANGPFPADTIFYNVYHNKIADIIVSMYHDQALAPLKLIHFHDAVNITLGLPFIRTSPDHGTAFDIAGKNIANYQSMKNAILLANKLK
jgi:4-phospho-D-threonate 3-dehydrogenase / 4-phospho-D-erythronate 3-dehydrogenase